MLHQLSVSSPKEVCIFKYSIFNMSKGPDELYTP